MRSLSASALVAVARFWAAAASAADPEVTFSGEGFNLIKVLPVFMRPA